MKKVLIFLVIVMVGCSKKSTYDVQIFNNTKYTLKEFVIGMGEDKDALTIAPFQTSAIVSKVSNVKFPVGEIYFQLFPKQWITPLNDTVNSNTAFLSGISEYSTTKLNTITITVDSINSNGNDLQWLFEVSQ